MIEKLQEHKIKIAIIAPLLLLVLIIAGAFYVVSSSDRESEVIAVIDPRRENALKQFRDLNIQAKSYVVYNATHREVIYSKNESAQLPLASLTKIMSAIVALDLADEDTIIDVKLDNKFNNPNDRSALVPGKWKLGDLLRLTLVSSSNGGINTISDALSSLQNFLGGEKHFLELMNTKAKTLGLNQTYFLNESGLDINDTLAGAYGSPIDVAILFNHALAMHPDIFGATRYDSIVINSTDGSSERAQNTNAGVSQIRGLVASKTGFTLLAQGNLAIAFDVDQDTRIIVVVLGSTQEGRFTDTDQLTRAALAYYSMTR
ncbi:MAG: hypothetical protein Q7S19_03415 [bacterium]|nr:hypothetical protein [bacterium]